MITENDIIVLLKEQFIDPINTNLYMPFKKQFIAPILLRWGDVVDFVTLPAVSHILRAVRYVIFISLSLFALWILLNQGIPLLGFHWFITSQLAFPGYVAINALVFFSLACLLSMFWRPLLYIVGLSLYNTVWTFGRHFIRNAVYFTVLPLVTILDYSQQGFVGKPSALPRTRMKDKLQYYLRYVLLTSPYWFYGMIVLLSTVFVLGVMLTLLQVPFLSTWISFTFAHPHHGLVFLALLNGSLFALFTHLSVILVPTLAQSFLDITDKAAGQVMWVFSLCAIASLELLYTLLKGVERFIAAVKSLVVFFTDKKKMSNTNKDKHDSNSNELDDSYLDDSYLDDFEKELNKSMEENGEEVVNDLLFFENNNIEKMKELFNDNIRLIFRKNYQMFRAKPYYIWSVLSILKTMVLLIKNIVKWDTLIGEREASIETQLMAFHQVEKISECNYKTFFCQHADDVMLYLEYRREQCHGQNIYNDLEGAIDSIGAKTLYSGYTIFRESRSVFLSFFDYSEYADVSENGNTIDYVPTM